MKRILTGILCVALLMSGLALAEEADPRIEEAKAFIQLVLDGDVEAYYDDLLDPAVQAQLPRETAQLLGISLKQQAGDFTGFGQASMVGNVALVQMHMASLPLIGQISFTDEGKIDGLFFTPDTSAEPPKEVVLAENEEAVTVGPKALEGTLSMPADAQGPVPAVVLVHGSGGHDRDEAIGDTAIFRDLAEYLSARGIAVLRYDKRAYAIQQGKVAITQEEVADFTAYEDTIEDAVAAVQLLKADDRIDSERVYILGHSQGGMLAGRMQQAGADADGLIILAGTLRHLVDAYIDQLQDRDVTNPSVQAELETAQALLEMTEEEARAATLLAQSAYFFWEEAQHDLTAAAAETDVPMLILQGTEDRNVFADIDYPLWEAFAKAHPERDITLKLYDGLDHMFTRENVMATEVLEDIAAWILQR